MKHLYSYILLSALFMSSCSNGSEYSDCLSQTNYCQDESNPYPEEELAGPNVFEHHNNQEMDDLLEKDKNAVRIDTKKGPIQRVLSYSEIVDGLDWLRFFGKRICLSHSVRPSSFLSIFPISDRNQ